tara:strand:- start:6567 stop:7910 length:1344 start_codon:yes stop_codon:yes gene_type:complete
MNKITKKNLKTFSRKFNKKKTNKVLKNVNTKNNFRNLVLKSDYAQDKKRVFKNKINIDTKITNQESSGRCWLFAFLNVMRLKMIKKYKLENFEFSQNYLFFYDRLEKANYYLNYIIANKNKKLNDIKLIHTFDKLTNDGGQWNMFVNLIEKYGIVPKTNMDDHYHSKNTEELNTFFNNFLRKAALQIRSHKPQDLSKNKQKIINELLYDCYKILVIFLGDPPTKITWEYYKKGKKNTTTKMVNNISPLDFYKKYVPYKAKDKICLINYPCEQAPFHNLYNVELAHNIVGEKEQNYINVPIDTMVDAVKKSIDNDEAVWVGVDFDKFRSYEDGYLDREGFNYKDVFGFDNVMDKCDSMDYRQSAPDHAVVLRGYNFEKGKTNGFLVENSWGEKSGYKGNYYMAHDWFKNYVFEAVIDKKCVSKKVLDVLNKRPKLLPYWSPFGNLLEK